MQQLLRDLATALTTAWSGLRPVLQHAKQDKFGPQLLSDIDRDIVAAWLAYRVDNSAMDIINPTGKSNFVHPGKAALLPKANASCSMWLSNSSGVQCADIALQTPTSARQASGLVLISSSCEDMTWWTAAHSNGTSFGICNMQMHLCSVWPTDQQALNAAYRMTSWIVLGAENADAEGSCASSMPCEKPASCKKMLLLQPLVWCVIRHND